MILAVRHKNDEFQIIFCLNMFQTKNDEFQIIYFV